MNTVSLTGHLTRDPELRQMGESQRQVATMRLAVDNRPYNATFIDVKSFGKDAPNCARYLSKGSRVEVTGRLHLEEWEAKDGGGRRSKHVVIGRVAFPPKGSNGASSGSEEPSAATEPQPVAAGSGADDDIPF